MRMFSKKPYSQNYYRNDDYKKYDREVEEDFKLLNRLVEEGGKLPARKVNLAS